MINKFLNSTMFYITSFIVLAILITLLAIKLYTNKTTINFDKVEITYENQINDQGQYHVAISFEDDKATYCSINGIHYKEIHDCNFDLEPGDYTLYLKQENHTYKKNFNVTSNITGEFSSTLDRTPIYYLALNGTKKMHYEFKYDENFNKKVRQVLE